MPGVYRYSLDKIEKLVEKAIKNKIPMIALFPNTLSSKKNNNGTESLNKNNLVWSLEGQNQEILVGNFVKTEFLNVKLIKLLPKQKTHVFEFKKNTSYLSLNDNIKVNIVKDKEEYTLSKKDGLYFPTSTQFFIENTNNHNVEIIFCEGL